MNLYWMGYVADFTDKEPHELQVLGSMGISRQAEISGFEDMVDVHVTIANQLASQRKAPPGTIKVQVLWIFKLERPLIIPGMRASAQNAFSKN